MSQQDADEALFDLEAATTTTTTTTTSAVDVSRQPTQPRIVSNHYTVEAKLAHFVDIAALIADESSGAEVVTHRDKVRHGVCRIVFDDVIPHVRATSVIFSRGLFIVVVLPTMREYGAIECRDLELASREVICRVAQLCAPFAKSKARLFASARAERQKRRKTTK